ncbi:hypothetical protein PMX38_08025, partial [Collinsella aerofaciens]|uniref:hypothetical protein n=1 Tax=Collinsella aerofaciens TaxID=74426 RepID=UPI00232DD445
QAVGGAIVALDSGLGHMSKKPQCFACIRGVWGFIERVAWLTHSRKIERGLHESNASMQRSRASLNLLMSKKRGV